jgi:hypothetical protein
MIMVEEVRQLRDELGLSEMGRDTIMTADSGHFIVENKKNE